MRECCIEGDVSLGRDDLDSRDEDRGRTDGFEPSSEVGGLLAGPRDEDAFILEGEHDSKDKYIRKEPNRNGLAAV